MSNTTKATTFWKFLKENTIEIPIIQRDYAQGRLGKENLRKTFLADLKKALDNEHTYKDTPMKLDFVYGSAENGKLNPLDGQQRLTTLWLLHWYIALRAGELNKDNCKIFRKFTYETRISSRECCENLCKPEYFENFDGNDIVGFITKQTWFYSAWKQDPTIQSMLRMLGGTKISDKKGEDIVDGIEEIFSGTNKDSFKSYWEKLTQKEAIVFYHLPLKDFGLSDDLYIKMNARGKQLTSFENFKADLIGYITNQFEDETLDESERAEWNKLLDAENGIPIKLDTDWTDIFWKNKSIGITDKESKIRKSDQIDEIYFAFLNRFFWNELFIAKKTDNSEEYVLDIGKGDESSTQENNNSSYNYLNNSEHKNDNDTTIAYDGLDVYRYDNGTIPILFFQKLKRVLDNYFTYSKANNCLPECPWDTSFRFIPKYVVEKDNNIEITNNANDKILCVSTLNQVQRIVFFAVCKYFDHDNYIIDNESSLKQWMRVVWNLVSGEDHNGRPEIRSTSAIRTAIKFIDSLESHNVYEFLSNYDVSKLGNSSFDERCKEEIAKAKQILNGEQRSDGKTWKEIIIDAEKYAFFKGAIRFLFSNGEKINWCDFDTKWKNAKSLIPLEKEKRDTVKLMIQFLSDDDLKDVFSKFNLSNDNKNLKSLLLGSPTKVHNFLMQQNKIANQSLLQNDLIYHCKQHPEYWIHIKWENGFDILSDYERKKGYYDSKSYILGNDFFISRLDILKRTENINISNKQNLENNNNIWKGLFIEFEYNNRKFRWQLNDWVDMYDDQMNNLWEKGLHSHYKGSEEHSFNDLDSLKKELDRCCSEYEHVI